MVIRYLAAPCCGLLLAGGVAAAQPGLHYESAYADYQPWRDEALASWREANDQTARIGGHAGVFGAGMQHDHGAMRPAAPAEAVKPPATVPAPPHHDHR